MKIAFTQKEYARLLEMTYIATWVAGAHNPESSAARRYAELEQKLLSLATPLGCADYVEGSQESGASLYPSRKLEEETPATKAIEDFEETNFWAELASRLAERDYARELLKNPLPETVTDAERSDQLIKRVGELEKRYWAEFEKDGLDNLLILFGTNRLS
jgi:hypothetical protein